MHVGALECEYAPECSGACIPLCVVSVCASGRCGRREEEWEKIKVKGRKIEEETAAGEKTRGKLTLHDECIRAQGADWERQSKHRYIVSKQTVRD